MERIAAARAALAFVVAIVGPFPSVRGRLTLLAVVVVVVDVAGVLRLMDSLVVII